jgi:hypothetical protein
MLLQPNDIRNNSTVTTVSDYFDVNNVTKITAIIQYIDIYVKKETK